MDANTTARKRNETGKRIWLPGTKRQHAAVERAARREFMRIGQYLMHLATKKTDAAGPAA